MFSPQALIKGLVSRALPTPTLDGAESEGAARLSRYRELGVISFVRKAHMLADEGAYFTTNNAQTGLATGVQTAFTATAPFVLIQNTDVASGKRIYVDYMALVASAAGAASAGGTYTAFAITIDSTLRFSALGTGANLTPQNVSPNTDINALVSVASVYCGALTATAASAKARTIVGNRNLRFTVLATGAFAVIGDTFFLNFGGVEGSGLGVTGSGPGVMANPVMLSNPQLPVVIGPQQSMLLHIWYPGATVTTGISFFPEISWWER